MISLVVLSKSGCFNTPEGERNETIINCKPGPIPPTDLKYINSIYDSDAIYVVNGDTTGGFLKFDIPGKNWKMLPNLETARAFVGGTISDKHIYVVGGIKKDLRYSSAIDRYSIKLKEWKTPAYLHSGLSRTAIAAVNNKVYIIGGLEGIDDRNCENTGVVYEFNPFTEKLYIKEAMPTARHGHSIVVIDHKILVIGGYTEKGPSNIVEEYDPLKNKWKRKADMPTARGFFGAVNINKKIYAIGGRLPGDSAPIEIYDYKNDIWEKAEPIPEGLSRFGINSYKDTIYITGNEGKPRSFCICTVKKQVNN